MNIYTHSISPVSLFRYVYADAVAAFCGVWVENIHKMVEELQRGSIYMTCSDILRLLAHLNWTVVGIVCDFHLNNNYYLEWYFNRLYSC